MEAIVVAIEGEPNDSEDQNLPEIHTRAPGGRFAGGLNGAEDFEDFAIHFRGGKDPL